VLVADVAGCDDASMNMFALSLLLVCRSSPIFSLILPSINDGDDDGDDDDDDIITPSDVNMCSAPHVFSYPRSTHTYVSSGIAAQKSQQQPHAPWDLLIMVRDELRAVRSLRGSVGEICTPLRRPGLRHSLWFGWNLGRRGQHQQARGMA
jgi:hypothetical protein